MSSDEKVDDPMGEQTEQELAELVRLAEKYLWSEPALHQRMQAAGVNIEPARFYSQLPTVDDILGSFEYNEDGSRPPVYQDATIFKLEAVSAFMRDTDAYAEEFAPPPNGDLENPSAYFWGNPAFSFCDAMSYWCAIRHYKPRRIVEIGSGFSSLLAAEALARNGSGQLTCIEPYPLPWLEQALPSVELIREPAQAMTPDRLNGMLGDGDILFIDSTHTVKIGSDCLWIYLKLLPAINRDIIVHVHDIYLPYGLDQEKALHKHIHWAECYLLLAYLIDNPRCELLFSSAMAEHQLFEQTRQFMRDRTRIHGGSLWFRQRPRQESATAVGE